MFSAPALDSNTSPRSSGSFYLRMVFKNKDLGSRFAHDYQLILFYINTDKVLIAPYLFMD